MSEEQAVADPIDSLPDEQSEMNFTTALDAAFENLEGLNEIEPPPEPDEPSEKENEETEVIQEDGDTEEKAEVSSDDSSTPDDDSFDPTSDLDDDLGDDWTPKAASRFKALKAELKESNTELDQLRQQVTEQDSKIKELSGMSEYPDYEEMKSKLESYEKEKMFSNLEDTDSYKSAVTKPLDALMEQTKEIADKYNIDADSLIEAFAQEDQTIQDETLSEMLSDATDRDKAKVYRIIEDINPILERRAELLENASEALNEANLASEKKEEQLAAEKLENRTNAARNVAERVKKKLPFLSGVEGLDMDSIQQKAAEIDPAVLHPVDATYNSISAQLLPTVVKEYLGLQKEVGVLTDRLAEYEDAEPTMSGTSPTSKQVAGRSKKDANFADSIEAAFATL
tara:strand:- start:1220 stop:2413 length:1194 start_codon:yes stop_codon:yes gene_type:complete